MIASWVLDSSVVLKWFFQDEILGDRALKLRDAFLEGRARIIAPPLLVYEVANVFRYKTAMTNVQIEKSLVSLLSMPFDWVAPTAPVMYRAVVIARDYNTSVYDAGFAAAAEVTDADLITADERLVRRLASLPYVMFLGDMAVSE
jgi:predicted nucleic acid-binding protein